MRREATLLLTAIFILVLVGVIMVYSASSVYDSAGNQLFRHVIFVGIGLVALLAGVQLDYHRLSNPFLFRVFVVLSLTLLVAVLVPGIGVVRSGARRWIEIGNLTFQPSELAKFALLLLLAVKLSANQEHIKSFRRGFLPYVLITMAFSGLILVEPDLGTPVVLCAAAFMMLAMAGSPWRFLLPSILPAALSVYLLSVTSEYRYKRLTAFLDPWSYRDVEGYQLIQSMTAFVEGSMWGRGPGGGEQKLFYLPEAHTDFIFAVWGEETGLVGSLFLIGVFVALLWFSLRIAIHARDLFGGLLAGGIVSMIGFQAAFNMAVTTGLLPTKGLPLPFISLGGTSLIVFMGLMGIVINIGLQADAPRRVRSVPAH